MSFRDKFAEFSHLSTDWRRLLTRGVLMLFIGITLIAFTLFKPDVMLNHSRAASWLPLCGYALLVLGLLECFDALISNELKDFFLNIQNGILDVVVASLIILSASGGSQRLSLLIAAFLIIKGLFRITITYAINAQNVIPSRIGAGVSILLGLFIWMEIPSSAAWFLAFCLSIEIAIRGASIIMFAIWLHSKQESESISL
jgi:uncharacterized membrane protein HdeD (DUF308 family)